MQTRDLQPKAMLPVSPAQVATVLMVDVRNFTLNLSSRQDSRNGRNHFCQFLSHFYDYCVEACETACMHDTPESLYVNSTGDGALCVFLSPERHFLNAYLVGLTLTNTLRALCREYNQTKPKRISDVSFGIGLDSGSVRRVASRVAGRNGTDIETYIGNCINIAARIEALTKEHGNTTMLISEQLNWLLCKRLFNEDYSSLMRDAVTTQAPNKRRRVWNRMSRLNESLLVAFMHAHNLRGVSKPMPLFRVSPTLSIPSSKEFQALLAKICVNRKQLAKVNSLMLKGA